MWIILGVGVTPSLRSLCLIFSVFGSVGEDGRRGGPVEASIDEIKKEDMGA